MNKRADISITILVVGVFALFSLAIVSFLISNEYVKGNFVNNEIFENMYSHVENFYFYLNSGFSAQNAADRINAKLDKNKLTLSAMQTAPTSKESVIMSITYTIDLNK